MCDPGYSDSSWICFVRSRQSRIKMRVLEYLAFSSIVVSCAVLASSCSEKAFEDSAKNCVNSFFAELKQNSNQDCSTPYAELVACIKSVVMGCHNKTDSTSFATMKRRSMSMMATKSYYCEDGMLNSFERNKLPDCRERGLQKIKKCSQSFHTKFRENRGGPSLCRKYSKTKRCIARALDKFCHKTDTVQRILKMYQDRYNPYCPGGVDIQGSKQVRSPRRPFGACSEKEYLIYTRVCMAGFVYTLQKEPNKTCRWAFVNKLDNCAKNIALHCFQNESRSVRKSIQRSFARYRPYQERKYCDGVNFQLSYPQLKHNQCKRNYITVKGECEASYIATYRENKASETLCRKYAEAKSCAKNATLSLCKNTPHLVDQVNFIYDRFNPFCFNLSDPPLAEKSRQSGDRVPRESGQWGMKQNESATGSSFFSTSGGTQSVNKKSLGFVAVASLLVARVLF